MKKKPWLVACIFYLFLVPLYAPLHAQENLDVRLVAFGSMLWGTSNAYTYDDPATGFTHQAAKLAWQENIPLLNFKLKLAWQGFSVNAFLAETYPMQIGGLKEEHNPTIPSSWPDILHGNGEHDAYVNSHTEFGGHLMYTLPIQGFGFSFGMGFARIYREFYATGGTYLTLLNPDKTGPGIDLVDGRMDIRYEEEIMSPYVILQLMYPDLFYFIEVEFSLLVYPFMMVDSTEWFFKDKSSFHNIISGGWGGKFALNLYFHIPGIGQWAVFSTFTYEFFESLKGEARTPQGTPPQESRDPSRQKKISSDGFAISVGVEIKL
jgi:hypothetical protein